MDDFDYWRLCEDLTIIQAALLICGHDPAGIEHSVEQMDPKTQPRGYVACKQALVYAIDARRVDGFLCYDDDLMEREPILSRSFVKTESLPGWLRSRGMHTGYFFPSSAPARSYLDPEHERYAPKLAAAVCAWEAVGEDKTPKGTPKQRVEKWLRLNASKFGLTQRDGKPNESAIQSIARIANWKPEGGAPATPTRAEVSGKSKTGNGNVVRLK